MSAVANTSKALHIPTQAKSKYRPEIDGLRAFAVAAVIINHFNKDLLPSGYLGVDIFFVISGYVITSSLADRKSKNFLDFVSGFYERRIKRLVPALVVFVLITSVLISLFNPDPGGFLVIGWKSLFGISNISLYQSSTDYFAQSTELNPFTHTWSLGVEEQFYLLFPFLIWFSGFGQQTAKGARNLFFWVGALTLASLIGFIYLYQDNQPAAYFLMPPRFWELAAGCLIFIGFQKRARIEQALEQMPPLLVVTGMVGVMFLPVSAAVPATIGIVVLSAVLIACLKKGTAAYQFFTLEKVVYIGLISYSLYLWHWTVLSISRWTIGIHWWSAPLQIALMLLLAGASYKWVEKTTRKFAFRNRKAALLTGFICLTVPAIALKLTIHLSTNLYTGDTEELIFSRNGVDIKGAKLSQYMGAGHQRVVVLGNSHARSILPLIQKISNNHLLSYNIVSTPGKPIPSINGKWVKLGETDKVSWDMENPDLKRRVKQQAVYHASTIDDETVQAIQELSRGDILILISRHYSLYERLFSHNGFKYYQTLRGDSGEPLDKVSLISLWEAKLERIIFEATNKNANVVFIAPLPEFSRELKDSNLCTQEWFRPVVEKDCRLTESRSAISDRRFIPEMKTVTERLRGKFRNFYVYDPFSVICPLRVENCDSSPNGKRLFSDNDHLSIRGALLLAKDFEKFLLNHQLLIK